MKIIEQAIHELLGKGRPLCCIVEDIHEAFFLPELEARNIIQVVLFERAL